MSQPHPPSYTTTSFIYPPFPPPNELLNNPISTGDLFYATNFSTPATPYLTAPSVIHAQTNRQHPVYQQLVQFSQTLYTDPNGMLHFNKNQLDAIEAQGQQALPALTQYLKDAIPLALNPQPNIMPVLAGLMTTEELLEEGIKAANNLYPMISQLDMIDDPLLTIYLAGVYGEMDRPEPYGWALAKLAETGTKRALHPKATRQQPHLLKVHEELGKVIMKQSKRSTQKTVEKLFAQMNLKPDSNLPANTPISQQQQMLPSKSFKVVA